MLANPTKYEANAKQRLSLNISNIVHYYAYYNSITMFYNKLLFLLTYVTMAFSSHCSLFCDAVWIRTDITYYTASFLHEFGFA